MAYPDRSVISAGSTPITGGGANRVLFEDPTGTFVTTSTTFTYVAATNTLSAGAAGNYVGATFGSATAANVSLVYNTSAVITASSTGATGLRFNGYGAGAITSDASGNLTAASDERLKRDIRPFERGLSEILGIRPILYGWTPESGLDQTKTDYAGFSAQQIQPLLPEAVSKAPDDTLSFTDRPIVAALVNAVQTLHARLMVLEGK